MSDERICLDGDVVIVTGAGRGLGRAYAHELSRRGARVVLNARRPGSAELVAEEIVRDGGEAFACDVPVGSAQDARALIDATVRRYGTVDAVVHNAGSMRNAYLEDQSDRTLTPLITLHVSGPFFITQAAWPIMCQKKHGRVVFTGSSAMFGMGGASNYATTKAAALGMGRALAFEGRPHGILVNVILPQATTELRHGDPDIATDPARAAAADATLAEHAGYYPAGLREALAPYKTAESIAPLVSYLVSRSCSLSGEALAAGCGRFARVFLGETKGWALPLGESVTPEAIAEHIDAVLAPAEYSIPASLYDEIEDMARAVGAWGTVVDR